jgi:hypothetical protein
LPIKKASAEVINYKKTAQSILDSGK